MARFVALMLISIFPVNTNALGAWYHDEPFASAAVVVWQYSEYPMPNTPLKYPSGLVVAVWPDGRIVKAKSTLDVGKSYEIATFSKHQLEKVLLLLDQSMDSKVSEEILLHVARQVIILKKKLDRKEFGYSIFDSSLNSKLAKLPEELMQMETTSHAKLPCMKIAPANNKWCDLTQVD